MSRLSFRLALIALFALAAGVLPAQSLARRVERADGNVLFTFASRAGVCGDGVNYVSDGFGDDSRIYQGDNFSGRTRGRDWPPCVPGPVRIIATYSKGELLRLRSYVGPRQDRRDAEDIGLVSVDEAVSYLTHVVEDARGKAANDAILPIVLADSITPWPTLLRFARDERLMKGTRNTINFWLARGAAAKLGLVGNDDDANDDVRNQAVFALSQQRKDVAVPQLIDIAKHNRHSGARAQALFWLGQSGDSRATDLFAEILGR